MNEHPQIERPLRAELFNADQMEQHGKTLALSHTLAQKNLPNILLARLADNERTLISSYQKLANITHKKHRMTPAGEWLLDNFYLIEEQIRITKHHLPKDYGRSLPMLVGSQGSPRVYDIALQNIAHGDGHWNPETLSRFVSAYQSVTTLTLGELWAIPIMLRLALIENLRRVSTQIVADQIDRKLADSWADKMIKAAESDPKKLILIIADMARSGPPLLGAFVSELVRRLQGRGGALVLPLTWIEQQLSENGVTIEQLIYSENQEQTINQVSISNSIASLRRLGELDWREFVERMSIVDSLLRKDPTGVYSNMDFATRDRYRHVIERLARASLHSEAEITAIAIQLAESSNDSNINITEFNRHRHVGFYLLGSGLSQLEQIVGVRRSILEKLKQMCARHPLLYYLGFITLLTIGLTCSLLYKAELAPINFLWLMLLGVAVILGTSQLAVALVNWFTMIFIKPQPLPRMDFSKGIPAESRTLVVVPAMLGKSLTAIESLVEALEVRFLGNRDDSLYFALLTDFNDAPHEHCNNDEALLTQARKSIETLNKRYPRQEGSIFFLFHRPRCWNVGEQSWMGYERKRGKLADLNALLRGGAPTHFSLIVGDTEILASIKYVITLDVDTLLPRESAREYVGTMAHPLNRPRYDSVSQCVVEGYGILQPRVAEILPSPGATLYARLWGCRPGIDPYTRMVSDVYQDLFSEGSFIGKGIYDVDIFKQVLEQRFPANHILSHDLLESCYLRSGLLTDVPLYEQSPGSYLADATRRIRWIRGDWQLVGWLLPHVLYGNGKRIVNRLSGLSRWKLFDNLRRSLVPIALLVLLILSWTVLPASGFWLGAVLAIILLPTAVETLFELLRKPVDTLFSQHLIAVMHVLGCHCAQLALYITSLPHEAWYSLCAIVRTTWRLTVSHRHLLEWVPSDQVNYTDRDTLFKWISTLWMGPVAAISAAIMLNLNHPESLVYTAPLLGLWFVSPLITWWLSRPFVRAKAKLTPEQIQFLESIARKTWGFFETFVTAEDHWLPPDNYQETPIQVIAHRTSPTNIGLALLANLTAYDFGYLGVDQLLERTANTLQTMMKLERYRGHFYNWYDTQTLQALSPRYVSTVDSGNLAGYLLTLRQGLLALHDDTHRATIEILAAQIFELAQMQFDFLYDSVSHLLTIGYNVDEQRPDRSYYDLLSSEARLGNFVAIAQGELPQESWFALGRLLTLSHGEPILVSWSGSMFEYLMPLLVMPSYDNTLLDQTCRAAVNQHINYGKQRGVPWGISESGLNAIDANLNYQYRAFGVPGLGLKRGLAEDLVIAPYASIMALMLAPEAACENLKHLVSAGAAGQFGFYEAIDYTKSRVPRGQTSVLVRSFMAHHQGMSFLALSYLLHEQPMQRRFMAEPLFQTALLLLQESIPKSVASYSQITHSFASSSIDSSLPEASMRMFNSPHTSTPEVQLLSNGRYHVMVTQAGSGYSRWKDMAVTRWHEDGTRDNWGSFSYLCDVNTGVFWSTIFQPTTDHADHFKAVFSEGHAEFNRSNFQIDVHTEIVVSPEDDIELRRLRIYNRAKFRRTIEFTSYGEVVLASQAADQDHPAFSNLFVETEILPQQQAILATRRPRTEKEQPPWMYHLLTVHNDEFCPTSFETDRAKFIGRGQTLATPQAMKQPGFLSNTAGAVLDPIVAIRCQIKLEPGAVITLDLATGIAESREHCLTLIEKYRDRDLTNRVFGLAWTHSQVLLHQLNISEAEAQLYTKLAGAILYVNPAHRATAHMIAQNQRGQSGLWGYAISGDLPIVLLQIENITNIDLVRQLVRAHAYWRQKGLAVDLVILNEEGASYRQTLQDQVIGLMAVGTVINITDRAGGIFVRMIEQIPSEDRILLQAVARVILSDKYGSLAEQLERSPARLPMPARLLVSQKSRRVPSPEKIRAPRELLFFNGLGGFTVEGNEYVITLAENKTTPAPWVNVLANPTFGTVLSESGQAYTWTENAHEFRLTPWNNDPVQDSAGEMFYLRDEETGQIWSPTPLPCRGRGEYETRHGFGYSVFEHIENGIHSELWIYVALDASIKFSVLKISNNSQRPRRLSATGYVEWVLGDLSSKTAMHVVTEIGNNGALLAGNHYNTEFGSRTAFFNATTSRLNLTKRTMTGDRLEFIGRNGSHQYPAALRRVRLSGRVGAGLDPCGAIQLTFDLAPGQKRELVFTLGAGRNTEDAETLLRRFDGPVAAEDALVNIRQYWQHTLRRVQVKTPDPAVDLLANGWLIYQTLSCRLWGRSGYYQSGGAFGFRDQLQDVMALVHAEPQYFRAHLLLCASRQFVEGDVQHWWHPPSGRGLRSRCSDDYLWLPFAICRYVETTGDIAVLDEKVEFLHGRPLNADEESYYELPKASGEFASLYQHGVRAILHGLKFGVHGLPLMGSGDWNDGMNLVGIQGRGESIWLGFFLYTTLNRFSILAQQYGDPAFAERCKTANNLLQQELENNGWDGAWYRRAYFDDGTPLGSVSNTECKIDSIAQSWSVLSNAAKPERAKQSMLALNHYLVRNEDGLVELLTPPFDHSTLNPGYIKGYVPGVRENGGQYTHAAIWAAMAFVELGENQLAWSLFNILNPINHSRTPAEIAVYKIEPYVVAADVYSVSPHVGRGGWSWYTGSAGWMYRLITESLLGLRLQDQQLHMTPCLPADWESFNLDYRYGETVYQITISRTQNKTGLTLDGIELDGDHIPLVDDHELHHVRLNL